MNKKDKDYYLCEAFLRMVTGNANSIAVAGDSYQDLYQVMPDEPQDQDFFDWYCDTYPDEQFFSNIYECVIRYSLLKKWYDNGNRRKMLPENVPFSI